MRKNKMMRTASGLLVLTLLTTGVISGTFAKYTTSDSAEDTARVAKWGVTALVSGSLYGQHYTSNTATENGDKISASTTGSVDVTTDTMGGKNNDNIIAPGTQSAEGLKLAISGKPEVANKVEVMKKATDFKEIFLGVGTYATLVKTSNITRENFYDQVLFTANGDTYTKADSYADNTTYYEVHDTATVTGEAYYPIQYTVTYESGNPETYQNIDTMYGKISDHFNTGNTNNAPDKELNKTATITWQWAFNGQNDDADTILGNLIAASTDQKVVKIDDVNTPTTATALTPDTDYCLSTDFDITLTVTQVD